MKVGIILINYHDYADRFLDVCASSLRKIKFDLGEHQIIIVDNDTSIATQNTLKRICPEAIVVPTPSNIGFGAGNNRGIDKAIEIGCDYFMIMNMDTEVDQNFLTEAILKYQSDDKIGLVQSRLMLYNEKDKINSLGNIAHFLGFGYCTGYKKIYASDMIIENIGYASGAAMLISRAAFEKIGYFNEEFFMYHDDLEWGVKSLAYGFKNVIAKDSVVYHCYEFSRSVSKFYWMERNRYIVWLSLLKIPTLIAIFPMALAMEIVLILTAIKGGWWKEKFRAYAWFFHVANWKKVFSWRHEIQSKRVINDRKLSKSFTAVIDFQEVNNKLISLGNIGLQIYWNFVRLIMFW